MGRFFDGRDGSVFREKGFTKRIKVITNKTTGIIMIKRGNLEQVVLRIPGESVGPYGCHLSNKNV
jgi:hypothetical protein